MPVKRGVGFCENVHCSFFAKGAFLINYLNDFSCPQCKQLGSVVKEKGFYTGKSNIFKEVRVEFNYDPINRKYREIAIIRDENIRGVQNIYILQSPLVKLAKRALRIAECILANLNRYSNIQTLEGIPSTYEKILSFDDPLNEFLHKLQQLSEEWKTRDKQLYQF